MIGAKSPSPSKGSYAAALKAKPTDWHLEFSLDDVILPLDMTIYGAIHNQARRSADPVPNIGNIWGGVYTIKFKKVAGPAPPPEGKHIYFPWANA